MGIFDRAIKKGLKSVVGNAVEQAVAGAVRPTANALADQAAKKFNEALGVDPNAVPAEETVSPQSASPNVRAAAGTLGGIFAGMQSAALDYANEAAKNMKVCPACGEPAPAENQFCPSCGAKLPETTLAADSFCASCGTQNTVGMKFCASCGAKLPGALRAERDFFSKWDACLSAYPKWNLGGTDFSLTEEEPVNGAPAYLAVISGTNAAALTQYRAQLRAEGFRSAGRFPSEDRLFKPTAEGSLCLDSSEAFSGNPGELNLRFTAEAPEGGFDEPKPKAQTERSFGWRDLFRR